MQLFKGCRTLTIIEPREKAQLTKVVSPLKRFGRYSNTHKENRDFLLKIASQIPSLYSVCRVGRWWGFERLILSTKSRFSLRVLEWRPNLFRGETTLVSYAFSRSWIVVNIRQPLRDRNFSWFFGVQKPGPPPAREVSLMMKTYLSKKLEKTKKTPSVDRVRMTWEKLL